MTEAIGFLNYGWTFVRAGEHLLAETANGKLEVGFPDAPSCTLIGHGIELLLKSYIWHVTSKEADHFHDLVKLLRQCQQHRLNISLTDEQQATLDYLNHMVGKKPYRARYLETGMTTIPSYSSWSTLARSLMDLIEPVIAPDRVRNVGLRTTMEPPPSIS